MLARLKKKGKLKLTREDILKYGTKEEVEFLREDWEFSIKQEGPAKMIEYLKDLTDGYTPPEKFDKLANLPDPLDVIKTAWEKGLLRSPGNLGAAMEYLWSGKRDVWAKKRQIK